MFVLFILLAQENIILKDIIEWSAAFASIAGMWYAYSKYHKRSIVILEKKVDNNYRELKDELNSKAGKDDLRDIKIDMKDIKEEMQERIKDSQQIITSHFDTRINDLIKTLSK